MVSDKTDFTALLSAVYFPDKGACECISFSFPKHKAFKMFPADYSSLKTWLF